MKKNSGSTSRTCYKALTGNTLVGILKKLDINMDTATRLLTPQYQSATLSVEHTGMWRICWWNVHPHTGKLTRVRKTFDLNRITDKKERKRIAEGWISLINQALQRGWNFFTPDADQAPVLLLPHVKNAMQPGSTAENNTPRALPVTTVAQALDKALTIRCIGKEVRTVHSYHSYVATFTQYLTTNDLLLLPVTSMTADVFYDYLAYKVAQGHGNRNINDHIGFFKTTFEVVRKKLKLIDGNPLADIDYLPKHDSTLFQPITAAEIQQIVPALIKHNPKLYLFTKFIAYEFIRPWHIARLKAKDINYQANTIALGPATTKNKKARLKELLPEIKRLLLQLGCDKVPGNYYLFGKDFEPNAALYASLSIRAAEQWRRVVIDGLGINKKMYALKHSSSQYLVNNNNNLDLKWLQAHMEHSSITTTEIYLQDKIVKKSKKGTKRMDY